MSKKIWIPVVILLLLAAGCTADAPGERIEPTALPVEEGTDYAALLARAAGNLKNAQSYALKVTSIRSYTAAQGGSERLVYGEFIEDIRVQNEPDFRVEVLSAYRFEPNGEFSSERTYEYREGESVWRKTFAGQSGTKEQISPKEAFPNNNDVLNVIGSRYADAVFIEEKDGVIRYVLSLAEWYTMKSAALFADLGMLYMQEDAEAQIEAYAREHYPGAAPILFTIEVDAGSGYIRQVTVDDRDFMMSVWEAAADAAASQGADPKDLQEYAVMPENGATYLFSRWNAAGDIEIPQ